jgi:hypothetical protein
MTYQIFRKLTDWHRHIHQNSLELVWAVSICFERLQAVLCFLVRVSMPLHEGHKKL